jgi:uroporphyrinogen-III decarboxylase
MPTSPRSRPRTGDRAALRDGRGALIRRELDGRVPLIGFSGSPWTVATYMVEGGTSKNFSRIKGMLYDKPALLHELLER